MLKQMTVIVKDDGIQSPVTVVSNLSTSEAGNDNEKASVDEVDGSRADKLLNSLKRLMFLKILIVDIGISAGDAITDILQGLNLIFDDSWNISRTAVYGVAVLATSWLPSLVTLLHLGLSYRGSSLYRNVNKNKVFILTLSFVIFFPLVPTILYIDVLFRKLRRDTNKEKLSYMEHEQRANQVKSIAGVIESPIQLVLLYWLMLQGFFI